LTLVDLAGRVPVFSRALAETANLTATKTVVCIMGSFPAVNKTEQFMRASTVGRSTAFELLPPAAAPAPPGCAPDA
jgi:hypothetical protein